MSSPFPGMDPYVEHPARWRGFHVIFVGELAGELNRMLPQPFFAVPEERVYVIPPGRNIYPDAIVLRRPSGARPGSGKVAVLDRPAADEPESVSILDESITEPYIEIRTSEDGIERVVALVELISPSNKIAISTGGREYRDKQGEALCSRVHLVEIDLLRAGDHTVAVPRQSVESFGTWDYIVSLHRADRPRDFSFWRCPLRHPLPTISIPLSEGNPDACVDLQAVFVGTYDKGPFLRRIDYGVDPVPPLKPDDASWADALLREAGLRQG
ncbi:MAG TPA: DUF4058 family protein [Chthonomonadaceae bacterium]|nr:DUF4058 family protein [Chthonomonadaceae bacterium]